MNSKEAREICGPIPKHNALTIAEAKGYLSCLNGEEVKALVEAVRKIRREDFPEREQPLWDELQNALAQYREAVKK